MDRAGGAEAGMKETTSERMSSVGSVMSSSKFVRAILKSVASCQFCNGSPFEALNHTGNAVLSSDLVFCTKDFVFFVALFLDRFEQVDSPERRDVMDFTGLDRSTFHVVRDVEPECLRLGSEATLDSEPRGEDFMSRDDHSSLQLLPQ
ncbi:hypothetical protein [Rhizobium leguminosarum]|uniref:hypothetical protein n=1 Tax=Rhizobium leguminosarum TaxID=384 RepID=UPI001FE21564|nr:hypothetical protein [Rhizobium leguminosarum]